MAAGCPICSKPMNVEFRPFCSRRCADVDLRRWLVGRYAIPAASDDEDNENAIRSPRGDGYEDPL